MRTFDVCLRRFAFLIFLLFQPLPPPYPPRSCGSEEVVRLLISEAADPTQTNHRGTSALHYAAYGGHEVR